MSEMSFHVLYGGGAIPVLSHFKYLGVYLQRDGGWQQQASELVRKVSYVSYLIRSVIVRGSGPSPRAVLTLVRSLLLPIIDYGFEFWAPSSAQLDSLLSHVVAPL